MKVYQLNDCEWWMAPTLEAAVTEAMNITGIPRDEIVDSDAHELTDEEMQRMTYTRDDGSQCPFAEEFARRMSVDPNAQMFATTEW